jgi:hypothetical protein
MTAKELTVDNKNLDNRCSGMYSGAHSGAHSAGFGLVRTDSVRTQANPSLEQISRQYRPITSEEQAVYDYLLYWIELESPQKMIERFRSLLINGVGCEDAEVSAALKAVVCSKLASEDFRYVLNRCCHILINRWQARPITQTAIPELVQLFETRPRAASLSASHSASVRRLHQLVQQFCTTEQYQTLQRLVQVMAEPEASPERLGTLIRRYPYLYAHCLLSEDSTQEQQFTVRQIQSTRQRQFEVNLAHYVTYQRRCAQVDVRSSRIIQPVSNPTLLNDQELSQALRYYIGKIDGQRTHRDQALNLLAGSAHSFAGFKADLYEYITATVDTGYGRRKFNNQLHDQLRELFPDANDRPLTDFLLVRTCNRLLSFLVVDSLQRPQHYLFVDLINNLGAMVTTGLLLKIVLLCRRVIPALERRLAILFSHYEAHNHEAVQWLVQALENTNLALTTNFGNVNLALTY